MSILILKEEDKGKVDEKKVELLALTMIVLRLEGISKELENIVNHLALEDFDESIVEKLREAYNNITECKNTIEEMVDTELGFKILKASKRSQ